MEDILKQMREAGFQPEVNTDTGGFEPVKGTYLCRIDSAGRVSGTSERTGNAYDFRSLKLQAVETLKGDKATNRFFDISYNLSPDGVKKLVNDLFTSGIEVTATDDAGLDEFLVTIKDKTVTIRCWISPKMKKEGDSWVEVQPRQDVQRIKVIAKTSNKPSTVKGTSPF